MRNKIVILINAIFLFIYTQVNGQGYNIQNTPSLYLAEFNSNLIKVDINSRGAFNLEEVLPNNYDKTGKVDYTALIQSVLNDHKKIVFPDCPLLINKNGLLLNNDQHLIFPSKSQLIIEPNSLEFYDILKMESKSDITLINPNIKGDKLKHKGSKGQWGHGIGIYGCENVKIYNAYISECWGDGIYITRSKTKNSNNVNLYNTKINNTRRNGISIISGTNININNTLISNINGTPPQFGIDIEPNNSSDILNNIIINNIITTNNKSGGILIALGKYISKSQNKSINITINNFTDDGSPNAFWYGEVPGEKLKPKFLPILGKVTLNNATWKRNSVPSTIHVKSGRNPELIINKLVIDSPKNKNYNVNLIRRNLMGNTKVSINEK